MDNYKELMKNLSTAQYNEKIDRLTLYVNFNGESTAIYHSVSGKVKQQIPYSCLSILSRDIALEETVNYQSFRIVPSGMVLYFRFAIPYSAKN